MLQKIRYFVPHGSLSHTTPYLKMTLKAAIAMGTKRADQQR
jgi:hypothetical protein